MAEVEAEPAAPPPSTDAGMLLMEHVNLNVLSASEMTLFYEALGCTLVPGRSAAAALHLNAGEYTQFHSPHPAREPEITEAQAWRGEMTLLYKDVADLRSAADRIRALPKEGTLTEISVSVEDDVGDVRVVGPYSNRYILSAAADVERCRALGKGSPPSKKRRLGVEKSSVVALADLSLEVPPGSAEPIARFYNELLGFERKEIAPGSWAVLGGPGGQSQSITLKEVEGCTGQDNGEHVCLYIGDYDGCFQRLHEKGLTWQNPRFVKAGSTQSLEEEAVETQQFRFKDIVDVGTGAKLITLEHEIRSSRNRFCPLEV